MDGAKEFKFGVTQNHLCELSNYVNAIVSGPLTDPNGSPMVFVCGLSCNCIADNTIKPRFNRKIRQFKFVPYRGFT